jgi:hypothetical protein
MRTYLAAAIAGVATMIITLPVMSQTTTPTSNTMSKPGPVAGKYGETPSHDGSASLTNSRAANASDSPGAAASPHTGYSAGMTPSAGTGSGTADGTTDTGATSPDSGKAATRR